MDPSFFFFGLGNPGDRFHETRHNVGFSFISALADRGGCSLRRALLHPAEIAPRCRLGGGLLAAAALLRPLTYMNRSGDIVPWLRRRYHLTPERICIVVDNMDLPPGEARMKRRGSASTHNGLRSISAALETDDYPRLYIGVGRPPAGGDVISHVLERPGRDEGAAIEGAITRVVDALHGGTIQTIEQMISTVNERRRVDERNGIDG